MANKFLILNNYNLDNLNFEVHPSVLNVCPGDKIFIISAIDGTWPMWKVLPNCTYDFVGKSPISDNIINNFNEGLIYFAGEVTASKVKIDTYTITVTGTNKQGSEKTYSLDPTIIIDEN